MIIYVVICDVRKCDMIGYDMLCDKMWWICDKMLWYII